MYTNRSMKGIRLSRCRSQTGTGDSLSSSKARRRLPRVAATLPAILLTSLALRRDSSLATSSECASIASSSRQASRWRSRATILPWLRPLCATQDVVYDSAARPVVRDVLSGYNATIMAYGQTGSGKTFTIFGPPQQPRRRGSVSSSQPSASTQAASIAAACVAQPECSAVLRCPRASCEHAQGQSDRGS